MASDAMIADLQDGIRALLADDPAGYLPARLGLIDFDPFAFGDIELDLATLLAELDYEEELTESVATIEAALVAGFRSAGLEVDRSRLQLYRAHKRMSKVTREAWALRTNGEKRARRHLPRILEDLAP